MAISVQCPTKRYVVILFQPVTLTCNYQTTATQIPTVTWRYKSYCRDPVQAALNPSSVENILSQNNPNYDPNIECADSQRTVRIVASKQANAVTLSDFYQGRKISITGSESHFYIPSKGQAMRSCQFYLFWPDQSSLRCRTTSLANNPYSYHRLYIKMDGASGF